jgi:hypothetical protein
MHQMCVVKKGTKKQLRRQDQMTKPRKSRPFVGPDAAAEAEKRRYARRMAERVVAFERAVHRLNIGLSDKGLRKCVKKSGAAKTKGAESGMN